MRFGIITYHRVRNYGSVLQSYALMKFLQNNYKNDTVEIIQYEPAGHRTRAEFFGAPKGNILKKAIYILASLPIRIKTHRVYKKFRTDFLKKSSEIYYNKKDFLKKGCDYDIYITGSDQVWNSRYNGLNNDIGYAYYLDFTAENKKRIAFSASFGEESLNLGYDSVLAPLVKRYSAISVREKSGIEKLNSLGFDKAFYTIDPTLLLDKNDWAELFEDNNIKKPYLLIYEPQRKNAEKFKPYALAIAKKYNLTIVKISKEYTKPDWCDVCIYPTVNQWLSLINNAEFVLTNSFHGIAFCVNFKKQFLAISANSANNRVLEFLNFLDLSERIVKNEEECNKALNETINYDEIDTALNKFRKESIDFLTKAIEE